MLSVVGKFCSCMRRPLIQNLVFSFSDPVDCYVYGVLACSMNVSGMIIDKGNPKYFEWNLSQCHLFTPSPIWFALRCTQNKWLSLTYRISHLFRTLLQITRTLSIAKYFYGFNSLFT